MTSSPFPSNSTATIVDKAIDGVFSVAAEVVDNAIFAAVPVLKLPILDGITEEAVSLIAQAVYKQFALFVTFEIIDIQTGAEANDSQKALVALKAAQKSGDPDEIQSALNAFRAATLSLTHLDGSAPPP